jgi:menaquinol-cytochrome c reductase iron-sulfur subunit
MTQPDPGASEPQADPTGDSPTADPHLSRRSFVIRAMTAIGVLAVAIVAVPVGAFVSAPGWLSTTPKRLLSHTLSPALRSEEWTSAGQIERLSIGQPTHMIIDRHVVDGWVEREAPVGVYVLRETDSKAIVLDPHCTHLGCPVEFSSGSGSFLCPCHGGTFDPEGYPTGGPPPRRMDTYETRVTDGEVLFRHLLDSES